MAADAMRWWENPDRNCADMEPETFFPKSQDYSGIKAAKKICQGCPVMDECLEDAMQKEAGIGHSGRAGIYGGMTARDRYKYHVARGRAA